MVPVLVKALKDPIPTVRIVAAEALNRVAPDAVIPRGVVPVLIGVLSDPDDQVAGRAAALLGTLGRQPSLAVPALLKSVQSRTGIAASDALRALGDFPDQAAIIVPVLLQDQSEPASWNHRAWKRACT